MQTASAAGDLGIRVFGNTQGLKASQVRALERLFRRSLPPERLVNHEIARALTEITHECGRQVGVLVDRRGSVHHVMVGDARSIELPDWGRLRAGPGRLRGLRCIHSHVGDEPLTRDDLTDLAKLRLDAMIAVATTPEGMPGNAWVASMRPANETGESVQHLPPAPPGTIDLDFQRFIRELEDAFAQGSRTRAVGDAERAILLSVTGGRRPEEYETALEELRELTRSAGVEVVEVVTQHRPRVDPRTLVGAGKLQDLVVHALQQDVDLVIVDQTLTPTQARNLAERMELRVIDRTQLILDIFAQRASTRDGKLQVELAQLQYRLPRLTQQDASLSRLGAGIGGRGPGETKLEVDRRRVRDRIARLQRELEQLRTQRAGRRRRRERRGVPVLSIVGYTNAGKSTLLRALTRSDVLVEDRMFATLDPTSRRLRFPREREVLVTDTVGFIRDLPPELVTAFRATLEELESADVFLHVVNAAAPDEERRLAAVRRVLEEIGLGSVPEILVFNQIDRLAPGEGERLAERFGAVAVSALRGVGLSALLERVARAFWETDATFAHGHGLDAVAVGGGIG